MECTVCWGKGKIKLIIDNKQKEAVCHHCGGDGIEHEYNGLPLPEEKKKPNKIYPISKE